MPEYLEAVPTKRYVSGRGYVSASELVVTPMSSRRTRARFWVIRHRDSSNGTKTAKFRLSLPHNGTQEEYAVPVTGKELTLKMRDSKMLVFDLMLGVNRMLYSTAEIFTR